MDIEERCEKTDLLVSMCAHCRNKGAKVTRRMTAEYRTPCRGCGGTINPGDHIGAVNDNWVCPGCVREAGA